MPTYSALIQTDPKKAAVWRTESGGSAEEVEKRLRQSRQAVLTINPVATSKVRWKMTTRDKMQFFTEMANAVYQELSIPETLGDFASSLSSKKSAATCREMQRATIAGATLDKAMRAVPGAFSQTELGLVEAFGKVSKTFEGLERCHELLDRNDQIKRAIQGALWYPAVVAIMGAIFTLVLSKNALPTLRSVYEGRTPPALFAATCKFVDLTLNNVPFMVGTFVIGIPVGLFLFRRWLKRPGTHRFILKLPKLGGMIKTYTNTNFLRTYTALTEAELTEPEKMRMCRALSPLYPYQESFAQATVRTGSGDAPHEVLSDYMPLFGKAMVGVFRRGSRTDLVKSLRAHLKMKERDMDSVVTGFKALAPALALVAILPPIMGLILGFMSGVVGLMSVF